MTEDSYALADLEELYIDSLWCAMAVGAEIVDRIVCRWSWGIFYDEGWRTSVLPIDRSLCTVSIGIAIVIMQICVQMGEYANTQPVEGTFFWSPKIMIKGT